MVRHARMRCDALRKQMYSVYRFIKSTKITDLVFHFLSSHPSFLLFLSVFLPIRNNLTRHPRVFHSRIASHINPPLLLRNCVHL